MDKVKPRTDNKKTLTTQKYDKACTSAIKVMSPKVNERILKGGVNVRKNKLKLEQIITKLNIPNSNSRNERTITEHVASQNNTLEANKEAKKDNDPHRLKQQQANKFAGMFSKSTGDKKIEASQMACDQRKANYISSKEKHEKESVQTNIEVNDDSQKKDKKKVKLDVQVIRLFINFIEY